MYVQDRVKNQVNLEELKRLNVSLIAIGLYGVFTWKDPELIELLTPVTEYKLRPKLLNRLYLCS